VDRLDWDSLSVVLAGRVRREVLLALGRPKTPSQLAVELDIPPPHVSRALRDLKEIKAVWCRNPRRRKGKLYQRAAKGDRLVRKLRDFTR